MRRSSPLIYVALAAAVAALLAPAAIAAGKLLRPLNKSSLAVPVSLLQAVESPTPPLLWRTGDGCIWSWRGTVAGALRSAYCFGFLPLPVLISHFDESFEYSVRQLVHPSLYNCIFSRWIKAGD